MSHKLPKPQKKPEGCFYDNVVKLALLLQLASIFFSDTLFRMPILQYLSIAFGLILIIIAAFFGNWRLSVNSYELLLILLVAMAIAGNKTLNSDLNKSWFFLFPVAILSSIFLGSNPGKDWKDFFLRCIVMFSLVHAVITIVCWCFPNFYNTVIHPIFFSNFGYIEGEGYQAGLTTHYSNNGMYLAFGSIAAFCLLSERHDISHIAMYLLILFALLLTGKRAHFAFSILSIICVYLLRNRKRAFLTSFKLIALLGIAIAVLLALSYVVPSVDLMFQRFSLLTKDDTMNGRTGFYDLCIQMFEESPVFGNGWGSYTIAFNRTELGAYYCSLGYTGMNAHNVFLQVLAELGIVGETVFCLILITGIWSSTRALLMSAETEDSAICMASLSFQLFFTMYCMTGNPLYDVRMYFPVLIASAVVPVFVTRRAQESSSPAISIGVE